MRSRARFSGLAVILVASALGPQAAHADLRSTPAPVTEAGCDVSVAIEGPIARVTETHRLAPGGSVPALAAYSAPLAPGAVVDDFMVAVAGREERGLLVPAESLENRTPVSLGLGADLGVLRVDHREERPVVDVRVFPVSPSRVTGFTVRWSAPLAYAEGRMTLTLPARGAASNLSRCVVRIDARGGGGVRGWSAVRTAGVWVGAGARTRGVVAGAAPDRDLVIEAEPTWRGADPVLAAVHADVDGRVLSTVAVYVPARGERRRAAPGRLLFVIDVSRSVSGEGRRAALSVIDIIGRTAPAGTPVEAVLFDRAAHRALGAWGANNRGGLERIGRALREATPAGGTDLAAALRLASDVVADQPTHVVVITDGVLPVDHTGAELLGHFPLATDRATVDVIVPLVAGAAAPDHRALEVLAGTFNGRVLAVPAAGPVTPAALTDELTGGLAIDAISLRDGGEEVTVDDLPSSLAAGAGVMLTTEFDRRPRRLTLHADRGDRRVTASAIALPAAAIRFALREQSGCDDAQLAVARGHHLIGAGVAAVVIDRAATGGAARQDLARRTGVYTFSAPPEELSLPAAPAAAPARVGGSAPTGELPRTSVTYALRDQLVPRLRVCYRQALIGSAALGGRLVVGLEIARGEVMAVHLEGDRFPEAMVGCVADAAYALTTPTYALGGAPDTIYVVRKPITFRPPADADDEPSVILDDVLYPAGNRPAVVVEPDAPL